MQLGKIHKLKNVNATNVISYVVMLQIFNESVEDLMNTKYDILGKHNNKKIINNLINCIDKQLKPLFTKLFGVNQEKSINSVKAIENLLIIVINNNIEFNRKFLRIKTDTDEIKVPETSDLDYLSTNELLYDKYILLKTILVLYHDKHIENTGYEVNVFKNFLLSVDNLFSKHYEQKITNNHYKNFIDTFIEYDINLQLLFFENTKRHLNIDNNLSIN